MSSDPMPAELAVAVLGNERRAAIVAALAGAESGLYLSEIVERTGLPDPTAWSHLNKMETWGFVVGDIPPGRRRGRSVRYSLDRGVTYRLLREYLTDMLGGSEPLLDMVRGVQADENMGSSPD